MSTSNIRHRASCKNTSSFSVIAFCAVQDARWWPNISVRLFQLLVTDNARLLSDNPVVEVADAGVHRREVWVALSLTPRRSSGQFSTADQWATTVTLFTLKTNKIKYDSQTGQLNYIAWTYMSHEWHVMTIENQFMRCAYIETWTSYLCNNNLPETVRLFLSSEHRRHI